MKKNTCHQAFALRTVLTVALISIGSVLLASTVGNLWRTTKSAQSARIRSVRQSDAYETSDAHRPITPFVFTVANTSDSGGGSFRQAIMDANSMGGGTIQFSIPGTNVHTISPLSVLPTITQPVVIDGYTAQQGASPNTNPPTMGINAVVLIELSGATAPPNSNFSGLTINADNCTVRGLVINSFQHDAMDVLSNGNVIAGNFIGTNAAGTAALPNGSQGVGAVIVGGTASNNTVGGTTPDARNLVSGNVGEGVFIQLGTGNTVQGNLIGTDVTGALALGNTDRGVLVTGANTLIGGPTVDARNVISANNRGVDLNGGSSSTVQGNFIGTDVTGTIALSNPNAGVNLDTGLSNNLIGGLAATAGAPPGNLISGNAGNYGVILGGGAFGNFIQGNIIGADITGAQSLGNLGGIVINGPGNTVGGTTAGAGNIIAFNGAMCASPNDIGVAITGGTSAINNAILGNSIFSNGGLGIDLIGGTEGTCGVTANEHCDPDLGPNDLQNYPVITSASASGGNVTVSGTLDSVASTSFDVEFFSSPACHSSGFGQGQHFLGSTNVTTDANCNASFGPLTFPLPNGDTVVTATATRLGSLAGCVSPPSNMVAWWPGDDNANDIQGGHNGTLQGTATFAPGLVTQAFSFSASNDAVLVPDSPAFAITQDLTLDTWINVVAFPRFMEIVMRGDSRNFLDPYYLAAHDGVVRFHIEDANGNAVNLEAPITSGHWLHVAGTLENATGTMTLYVNGAVVNQTTTTIRPFGDLDPTQNPGIGIGNLQDASGQGFDGLIDEVEIFNRALSQSEIQSIVNAGSAGKCKLTTELETSEFSQCVTISGGASPTPTPTHRVTPTPRPRPTPKAR